jgi:hypothetical protein
MNAQIIDLQNPLWLETLQQLHHDVYHLPEYLNLEAQRNDAIPEALLITDQEKIFFVPYLLRQCEQPLTHGLESQAVPEPIYDAISPYGYSGILLNQSALNSENFPNFALDKFKNMLKEKGVCSAFLRLHPILNENFNQKFSPETLTNNGKTVSIDLTLTESQLWAHTRKGHQSTINKCKRLGFTSRMVSFEQYLNEFDLVYKETMSRVRATESYYFNNEYFFNLLKLGKKLHLCIVEFEEQIAATSLFFECCGIVQAHLGGTKNQFLRQSPFNLLLHYARLWAKERGNHILHIGGGIGGSEKDSLYTFKSGFSRQRHDFQTLRLIIDEEKYSFLVDAQASISNINADEAISSGFFPAYRFPTPR